MQELTEEADADVVIIGIVSWEFTFYYISGYSEVKIMFILYI
jgi:hypothetical protein